LAPSVQIAGHVPRPAEAWRELQSAHRPVVLPRVVRLAEVYSANSRCAARVGSPLLPDQILDFGNALPGFDNEDTILNRAFSFRSRV